VQAQSQPGSGVPYRPLPPDRLYVTDNEWRKHIDDIAVARLSPFAVPEQQGPLFDIGAKQGRNFAAERTEPGRNVFEAVTEHVLALQKAGKRVIVALWSDGSRDRMQHVLADHRLANLTPMWQ
jgi:transcription-repair coupling factor (superfamily II helicase)